MRCGSVDQHAPVDVERDAGAVRGQLAGQEDAGAADVFGSPQAGRFGNGGEMNKDEKQRVVSELTEKLKENSRRTRVET